MINEPSNEELNEIENAPINEQFGMSLEEWNASCELWDLMHDEYGLHGM